MHMVHQDDQTRQPRRPAVAIYENVIDEWIAIRIWDHMFGAGRWHAHWQCEHCGKEHAARWPQLVGLTMLAALSGVPVMLPLAALVIG